MAATYNLRLVLLAPAFLIAAWLLLASASERYAGLGQTAPFPPGRLAANAMLVSAAEARTAGDLLSAQGLAAEALRREPLNQDALGLLGQISRERGDEAAARRFFVMSAQLGWREPLTQLYWFERARSAGDFHVAAQRLEAILRAGWNPAAAQELLLDFEATPEGRRALARRMKLDSSWAELTIVSNLNDKQLKSRGQLLLDLAGEGAAVDPKVVGNLAFRLLGKGYGGEARDLWARLAAPSAGRESLLFDGGFEAEGALAAGSENRSPFIWQLGEEPGVFAAVEPAPPPLVGRALHVRSEITSTGRVAGQSLTLAPSRYQLSWRQVGERAELSPQFTCSGGGSIIATRAQATSNRHSYSFEVPASRCPAQRLIFVVKATSSTGAESWVDDVRIDGPDAPAAGQNR